MIRRAQTAILNPSTSPLSFLVGEIPQDPPRQLHFSSNVVCIDLLSPDVTDLSFIDLPGIISNVAPGEDRSYIAVVKEMVRSHIKGNTLILLTITMRDDIDNQGAADLAHTEDPLGEHTIGILTKPDTLQRGEERTWMKILEGSSHPLKYGYFMTKQASPEELEKRMSFEDARKSEREWFQTNAPWKDMSNFHNRMGTRNLTKELSRLLGAVINQALPKLCKMSKESLQQVSHDIAALPPPRKL